MRPSWPRRHNLPQPRFPDGLRVWHKKGVTHRQPRPPLTQEKLAELALTYVGRFATSRMKLRRYLAGKVRERGWDGPDGPQIDDVVDRCVRNGFVDDAAFALAKARSLSGRGYGSGRVRQSLRAAGISDVDSRPAHALAREEAAEAALRLARRKRIGPFAAEIAPREMREKQLAAMIRAGHKYSLAKAILALGPGEEADPRSLSEAAGMEID
jgi:regulatory protein